jgi:hypothetical protein
MHWAASFSSMRHDHEPREWIRWSELLEIVRVEIPAMGTNDVRAALRAGPASEKRYGHRRYFPQHVDAVRAWATERGLA